MASGYLVGVYEVVGVGLADFQLWTRHTVIAGFDWADLACYLALCPSHAVWSISKTDFLGDWLNGTDPRGFLETRSLWDWERVDSLLIEDIKSLFLRSIQPCSDPIIAPMEMMKRSLEPIGRILTDLCRMHQKLPPFSHHIFIKPFHHPIRNSPFHILRILSLLALLSHYLRQLPKGFLFAMIIGRKLHSVYVTLSGKSLFSAINKFITYYNPLILWTSLTLAAPSAAAATDWSASI